MTEDAKAQWEEIVSSYMQYNLTEESTEDDKAAARADAEAQLLGEGYTEDTFISEFLESQTSNELITRLRTHVAGDVAVTDEDVQAHYDELVKEDQDMYGSDVGTYEFYTQYYGQPSYYTPEGYRGITHILLPVDEELLNAWKDLQARLEEQDGGETEGTDGGETATETPEEPVTQEMVDAAKQAILDSVKEKVDEINAKLADGASFEDLILEYGTDTGMADDERRANGYPVHAGSIMYDSNFAGAAMALEKVGDISDPVVSQFGVHILHYVKDIPGGAVELTDDIRATLKEQVLEEKKTEAYDTLVEKWMAESEITWTEAGESWKLPEEEAAEAAE